MTTGSVTAPMTEPTPRTDAAFRKAAYSVEDELRGKRREYDIGSIKEDFQSLERQCARQFALLRRWVERKKAEGGLLQDGLLEDTERELEQGK
jgi:hypothetical protein